MIIFCYLLVVKIYGCDNFDTLDVIGLPVPKSVNDEQKSLVSNFKDIKYSQLEAMIADGKIDDQFRPAYLLYALLCFLCPTSQMTPSSKLLVAIVDVQNLHNYNWSNFIFDWPVKQIEGYKKKKKGKTKSIGGCVFCLMVCNATPLMCLSKAYFVIIL